MFFFFPVRDEFGVKKFPFVIALIIAVNVVLFFIHATSPEYESIVLKYGFTPARFSVVTLFTSMFLHGGILHLGFNMWYLWLFGNNIEDRWGPFLFLLFYLSAGVFSMFLYSVLIPEKMGHIPTIGASGAISAVLGAYAILFPKTKITFKYFIWLFIIFIKFGEFKLFASVWFAVWFLQQALSTFLAARGTAAGSVAFGAHFAGFVYGVVIGIGTRLYREARFRENVKSGENLLSKLTGRKQFVRRTIEEYGEIEQLKSKVLDAFSNGDSASAATIYAGLISKYPETTLDEKTQYAISLILERQNRTAEALTAYRNLLLNYPYSKSADRALLSMGKILLGAGDEEKAKYAFLQVVLFYPYSEVYEEAKYNLEYNIGG